MEHVRKVQIGLLFLVCNVVVFFYVLPSPVEVAGPETGDGRPVPDYCELCLPNEDETSTSAYAAITSLRDNCGASTAFESLKPLEVYKEDKEDITEVALKEEEVKEVKEEKKSNLIYEIIIVLLLISVTLSLADYFQERKRRKAINSNLGTEMTMRGGKLEVCNRRMSLADLTISRHARKESQAGYRPPAGPSKLTLGLRSSSQESPQSKHSQISRQTSCPQPLSRRLSTVDLTQDNLAEDGGWAERRRVRMIQRH